MPLRITQTLLASWNYMFHCHEGCEETAKQDFLDTLMRVKKEPTPAILDGLQFEDLVYQELHKGYHPSNPEWENGIRAIANLIEGAQTQIAYNRVLTLGAQEFAVFGIVDALRAGIIYDIKFSSKSFSSVELAGKYLHSPQHPTYLFLLPEAREFTYLVSDGEDLYTETYTREDTRPLEEIVSEFMDYLEFMGLMDVYEKHWRR